MHIRARTLLFALPVLACGCGSDSPTPTPTSTDDASADSGTDTGGTDTGSRDTGGMDSRIGGDADATSCVEGETRPCETSCGSSGTEDCIAAGRWSGTCTPASEICGDDVDNDCDGSTDNGTFEWIRLSDHASVGGTAIVWSGTEYGVAWDVVGEGLYFARVSAAGAEAGSELPISTGEYDWWPSIAWTGEEFGVAFERPEGGGGEAWLARVSAIGEPIDDPAPLTSTSGNARFPSMVFTDTDYAVVWHGLVDTDSVIELGRAASDGSRTGEDLTIAPSAFRTSGPTLVWTGSGFGVAWADEVDDSSDVYEMYFARVAEDGSAIGSPVPLGPCAGAAVPPALAWDGTHYVVAWATATDSSSSITIAAIDSSGVVTGTAVAGEGAGRAFYPALTATADGFALAWQDRASGMDQIHYLRLAADGSPVGAEAQLTDGSMAADPAIASSGTDVGIAYARAGLGAYFGRVTSCP